ncbi:MULTISPECIES: hypothetical protein [unclassified Crossiella]|uniref:hypothetical protein n=1 Tax=unclassified Crossiella TaxID=2620835 RepID=UPI001FFF4ACD|nr:MULTISPECIES: hypothetical protein [unclassified Crossiella]MCK2236593.1 hypothetical protein [Crossiella sp. S99.2]MCK2250260.1 hypothetical protein [Crossiella sp. S99.1]
MDLTPYVENLRNELAVAAEAGGAEARALADRLSAPLDSAVRLTLLEALSTAADEITRELAPGSVDLRLRGGSPTFVVTPAPGGVALEDVTRQHDGATGVPSVAPEGDDGPMSRINLRLAEQLKTRIEEAAGRERLSVNAWLVRAAAAALEPEPPARRSADFGQKFTGWVR